MTIASKLTKSVRQAKISVANQNNPAGPDEFELPLQQENKVNVNAVQKKTKLEDGLKTEPSPPAAQLPYRRVWPD